MLLNKYFYRPGFYLRVGGFVVPKEFIVGSSLESLEKILGYKKGRLKIGAAFAQLYSIPHQHELEYYGDTSAAQHRFEERRNKEISQNELSNSAFSYLQPNTKLIKVIPLQSENPLLSEDENWPSGTGAMQFKIRKGIVKPAVIINVVENYPSGIFVNPL